MPLEQLKRLFVGTPLPTAQQRHERLGKATALATFASDALLSVAYATEEILLVLILAGTVALSYSLPIGVAIAVLIAIVVSSYRQTIRAYPQGGGQNENHVVTIVIPEFIPARWWQLGLHNQTALLIKGAMLFRKNVIVTDVPYHLTH